MHQILLVIMSLGFSCLVSAEEIVGLKDGRNVILKDNKTWEYVLATSTIGVTPKYAEDAVIVWDTTLLKQKIDYGDAVTLSLHYQNNTNKKVIGIEILVAVKNAFGKIVLERTFEDEVVVLPNERLKNSTYYIFSNNQFISDEPYDRMWQMAELGTAKIDTKIRKVIFDDGLVLKNKPLGRKKV